MINVTSGVAVVRRQGFSFALLVVACLAAAACSRGDEGGFGVPRQPAAGSIGGTRQALSGVISVQANGCVDLDLGRDGLRWVVWPSTATSAQDGGAIVVAGAVARHGMRLTGTGTVADATVLPGWSDTQGYFGSFGRFCKADQLGVVILDDVSVSGGS